MVIPAAVTAVFLIILMTDPELSSGIKEAKAFGIEAGFGIGCWIMWIGAIGTAVLPFTPLAAERGFYLKR